MIPSRLIDKTTLIEKLNKSHTTYSHLVCVIIRILLGLMIYYKYNIFQNNYLIIILSLFIILLFGYKLIITHNKTWKVYLRTILIYIIILIINLIDSTKSKTMNNISGILIIIDALMGLQSRHIQNNFKE